MVAFFNKKEPQDWPHCFGSRVNGAPGAEKGRAGGQTVGICRGSFVLILQGQQEICAVVPLQASSSSCCIRYVASKITKTLIGRGRGPLNHIACPYPSNTSHLPKMLANAASLLKSEMPTQQSFSL